MSEWIEVGDGLPKDNQLVLIFRFGERVEPDDRIQSCRYSKRYGFERTNVMCWMPIESILPYKGD